MKVHNCNRLVSSSPASFHCVTDMEVTAKFSVGHLGNVGVWIDMATSYQGQRLEEYLTVDPTVRFFFIYVAGGISLHCAKFCKFLYSFRVRMGFALGLIPVLVIPGR